ncbi:MAG TPA: hypothetical protein VFT31_12715 [Kribbella sp.]|nr:hypothetical protein [Kribbella sp.]
MYVGGSFTQVKSATYKTPYNRSNFLSFNVTTGAMTSVRPTFDGPVWALALS